MARREISRLSVEDRCEHLSRPQSRLFLYFLHSPFLFFSFTLTWFFDWMNPWPLIFPPRFCSVLLLLTPKKTFIRKPANKTKIQKQTKIQFKIISNQKNETIQKKNVVDLHYFELFIWLLEACRLGKIVNYKSLNQCSLSRCVIVVIIIQ